MMEKHIFSYAQENGFLAGITRVSVVPFNYAVVCAFPYYTGEHKADFSKYAIVPDYHIVLKKYLEEIKRIIINAYPGAICEIFADNNNLPERFLAQEAGIGFIGKNQCLITPGYGSFVFLGEVLTTAKLLETKKTQSGCMNCGKCIAACPGGALKGGFNRDLCLSEISQKKVVTNEEMNALNKAGIIWGCDICQDVCPHNSNLPLTKIPEFSDVLLSVKDDMKLSNKEFLKKHKNRAFSWRGKNVLKRNYENLKFI